MNTERVAQVTHILKQHVAFKDEAFQPHPRVAKVFRTPSSWLGKTKQLRPVAFEAHIHMFEMLGCVSSTGGMSPYLWLDDDGRLIGESAKGKLVPVDISLLTDKDIVNLEVGIKGDKELLDAEYDKVHQVMLDKILS